MMPRPHAFESSALDEEIARAELYGLLALLYYAPPAASVMDSLQVAVTDAPVAGVFLEEPWRALIGVARSMSLKDVQNEYDTLFGGIGKPEVYLYGSHFLSGFLNEKPLAKLRSDLAALGLTRDDTMTETEDHIAYLCEVMRFLIAGDDAAVSNLANQRTFFAAHLQPWVSRLCDDIEKHPQARFYAVLTAFTRAFFAVEIQGFDMLG
jgi:TorA maturation chaperone TorD